MVAKKKTKSKVNAAGNYTKPELRTKAVDDFQSGKTNLFIGQITAAGVGLTLTRASICVLAELTYSPAEIDQAVSRLHRITQVNPVTAYYFQVDRSIDDDIVKVIIEKASAFKQVLDEKAVA